MRNPKIQELIYANGGSKKYYSNNEKERQFTSIWKNANYKSDFKSENPLIICVKIQIHDMKKNPKSQPKIILDLSLFKVQ